ncbi:lutropin-choriogonadotropic hormone receptor isoform X2 [Nematostella vectensis]|uniref:lutropin-choriogonadotropic hormone receptor isoform X2 n=1 Tax=Nematostella vectensis TaxID=45351 RepID=UPI002077593D|nr:lutropin-choriogonadotropic hormone receptor isoform X2 [Nematostella vectensis]
MARYNSIIVIILLVTANGVALKDRRAVPSACRAVQPCVCTRHSRGLRADCKGKSLISVPQGLPASVFVLDLSQNNISSLPARSFANYSQLQHLYLQSNRIRKIHKDAFVNLRRLKSLDLKENSLSEWPELSQTLPELQSLFLDYNDLTVVPDGLKALSRLQHLNLNFNRISKVPRNAFNKLRLLVELKIASNAMVQIEEDAFAGLHYLVQLNLRGNKLKSIPTSAINDLMRLQQLELDGNPIRVIKDHAFKGLSRLTEIALGWEKLEEVYHNAFTELPLLRRLPLGNVKLKHFPNLTGTHSLQILTLESNYIEYLPRNFCGMFPKLYDFNANMNKIKRIPDMSGCKSMELLKLVHNQISSIGSSLQGMARLKDLTLEGNRITEVNDNTFKGVKSLETLDLAKNQIKHISKNAFSHFERLQTLDLSENLFVRLPSAGMQQIRRLYLRGNRHLKELSVQDLPRVHTVVAAYPYHCCGFRKKVNNRKITGNGEAVVSEGAWYWTKEHEYLRLDRPGNSSLTLDDDDLSEFGSGKVDAALGLDTEFSGNGSEPAVYNSTIVGSADSILGELDDWQREVNCTPLPDPFFPCEDLMGSWLLRMGVWIVFMLALLGNVTVIIVILVSKTKMDVSRFLIVNLAVADMCMGLYLGLLAIVDASTIGDFLHHGVEWQLSTGCKTAGFLALLSSEASVFTLTVITIERFIAIRHALHIHKKMSLRKTTIVMVIGWGLALIIATLPLAKVSDYTKVSVCLPFEIGEIESLTFVTFTMVLNCAAFLVIFGCYVGIYLQVRGSNAWNTNDTQVALRMSLLVVTDLMCWAPIAFLALTATFGTTFVSLNEAKVFTVFCFPLNSCANPFLYAIFTSQFKKDCLTICRRVKNSPVPPKIHITLSKKRFSVSGAALERGSNASAQVPSRDTNSDGRLLMLRLSNVIVNRRFSLPPEVRLGTGNKLKTIPQESSRSLTNSPSSCSNANSTEQTTLNPEKRRMIIEMETAL